MTSKSQPQKYRLKVAMQKLSLPAGHTVYRHPTAIVASGKFPAALEPRADACWFPVDETSVEAIASVKA